MIYFYSGTPGSGKSLNVARDIYYRLNRNKKYPNVIANFSINKKMIKNKKANFIYKDNIDMTVNFLVNYALENHKLGIENQTLVVVDECSVIWNARGWNDPSTKSTRMEWLKFFVQHRKLGYDFILISQNDRQIDRQIRDLIEYEVTHRKINNFKIGKFIPVSSFIAINRWYGVKEKLSTEFFIYRKKWGNFYDSYGTFALDTTLSNMIDQTGGQGGSPSDPILDKNNIKNLSFIHKIKSKFKHYDKIDYILLSVIFLGFFIIFISTISLT